MKHFTWTFYIRTCMGEWFCRKCPGDAGKRVVSAIELISK